MSQREPIITRLEKLQITVTSGSCGADHEARL